MFRGRNLGNFLSMDRRFVVQGAYSVEIILCHIIGVPRLFQKVLRTPHGCSDLLVCGPPLAYIQEGGADIAGPVGKVLQIIVDWDQCGAVLSGQSFAAVNGLLVHRGTMDSCIRTAIVGLSATDSRNDGLLRDFVGLCGNQHLAETVVAALLCHLSNPSSHGISWN